MSETAAAPTFDREFDEGELWVWCPHCPGWITPFTERGVVSGYAHTGEHADVSENPDAVEREFIVAPRFGIGSPVRDAGQDRGDRGTARVIAEPGQRADQRDIPDLNQSVASFNTDHPPGAPVYELVFEGWLDSNVPDWEERLLADPDGFGDAVRKHLLEWKIPAQFYHYPATRLVPRWCCTECGDRLEYRPEPAVTGYGCPNPACDEFLDEVFVPEPPYPAPYPQAEPSETVASFAGWPGEAAPLRLRDEVFAEEVQR